MDAVMDVVDEDGNRIIDMNDAMETDEHIEREPILIQSKSKKTRSSFDGVKRYVLGFGIFKKIKCNDCLLEMKKDSPTLECNISEVFMREKDLGTSI